MIVLSLELGEAAFCPALASSPYGSLRPVFGPRFPHQYTSANRTLVSTYPIEIMHPEDYVQAH
jgi:hypothetical protein